MHNLQAQQNELNVTGTWQKEASHGSPSQKFYGCLKDSPKEQRSLRGNLWVSHWVFWHIWCHINYCGWWLIYHLWNIFTVREWQKLMRHLYLFGCNVLDLFFHFALPEQEEFSLLLSHLEFGAQKLYLVARWSDSTLILHRFSTTFSVS